VLTDDLYAAVLAVVVVTTFLTPPLCKPVFAEIGRPRRRPAGRLIVPYELDRVTLGPRW
jgi:hypothetical protein